MAADIYQRSLAYANKITGNAEYDWRNTALSAVTSLYMAIKMTESNSVDAEQLKNLSGKLFASNDIIRTEAALVQMFGGIIYPKNLFTETEGKKSLLYTFELLRNCHKYYRIILSDWKKMQKPSNYNKYVLFSDFFEDTEYYKLMITENPETYIKNLYSHDL